MKQLELVNRVEGKHKLSITKAIAYQNVVDGRSGTTRPHVRVRLEGESIDPARYRAEARVTPQGAIVVDVIDRVTYKTRPLANFTKIIASYANDDEPKKRRSKRNHGNTKARVPHSRKGNKRR